MWVIIYHIASMWILTSKEIYKQNMWAIYVNNMWGSIQLFIHKKNSFFFFFLEKCHDSDKKRFGEKDF